MNPSVNKKFYTYPIPAANALKKIRKHILLAARECDLDVEETLKWGEPSYVCKEGSTIRFDWKAKSPAQYVVYFNCQTSLVETFRELYRDEFTFEGNRAMVFQFGKEVNWQAFRHCVSLSLRYHKIKHLPLLGA
ncbi:MAG: DUF1801 domain-containing protein [Marinicella sp.]|nr:DUF1801 domain-containing protein [Xanthomonadales bacterium]